MTIQVRSLSILICLLTLVSVRAFGQTARRQTPSPPSAQESATDAPVNSNDVVANEIASLRRSLDTLNVSLRDISAKLLAPGAKGNENEKQNRVAVNLDLLTRAEQRAEMLRKQLLELIEKETTYRSRIAQLDEEMRPDNVERALNPYGTTRTTELRETRRRVLENERRGFESLLNLTSFSRVRLEEDVKQADSLVSKLRQRLLPLIEREIEKITPN
jgi:hypothetical protein